MNKIINAKHGWIDASSYSLPTDAGRAFYHEQGYLIAENAFTADEVNELTTDAAAICRGEYGPFDGWVGPHEKQTDDEVMQQYLCIHFPHKCSAIMRQALLHRTIVETLSGIISPNVKCMQSMLFIKAAGKPGQSWHQDELYIPTRDRSLTGAWIALDDATINNGCLWVIPGSHKHGVLWPQRVQDDPNFDCSSVSDRYPYTQDDAVPVEVTAGSIVFFNGYLLHQSLPNIKTQGYRRALVNHYMSAESLLPWTTNLQEHSTFIDHEHTVAKADMRDIVMVCGEDPYAWLGLSDVLKPYVRPSGEGGCARTTPPAKE